MAGISDTNTPARPDSTDAFSEVAYLAGLACASRRGGEEPGRTVEILLELRDAAWRACLAIDDTRWKNSTAAARGHAEKLARGRTNLMDQRLGEAKSERHESANVLPLFPVRRRGT